MSTSDLRGILAILVTPFDEQGRFDESSFRSQIDFTIDAGARAVISTAIFGEFFTLSDSERKQITRVMVDQTAGRVPAIATTSGVSAAHAVELSTDACDAGADMLMIMPPYISKLPPQGVYEYFGAINDAVDRPIIIQNAAQPVGAPVSADDLARMLRDFEYCRFIKEEVPPNPHSMFNTAVATHGLTEGIFGGFGGLYLITEHRRGCTGWMVAPQFTEILVKIDEALQRGDEGHARELHQRLLPGLVLEHLLGIPWAKRALQIRGVIKSDAYRIASPELQPEDEHELKVLMQDLTPIVPALADAGTQT
jgi:dihydrodipicolinate synthase/N-acetylneuraminate lyase